MAATHVQSSDENAFWDAVGGTFVAALNDGLARARHSTLRSRGVGRLVSRSPELSHPFAAAVMRAFEAALPGALTTEDQASRGLQASLRHRGQEIVVATLDVTDLTDLTDHTDLKERTERTERTELADRHDAALAYGGMRPLLPRHEHLVVTLLMESAALVLSERPGLGGTDGRPAALVRALGRRARSGSVGG
ncbi:hypothetical protein [Streptomyces sp. NPDC096030]|uniref:hypothetical protein n=1 Tax=Streptomyces sp. NPDC096030 TaxID=3155423 RepID=UPI003321E6BE